MKLFSSIIFLLVIYSSCTPPVVFDTAYPSDVDDLKVIPDDYQGAFICESDSTLIIIDDHIIYTRKENYFEVPLKFVDEVEGCYISGGMMYIEGQQSCIPLEFVNDSIVKGKMMSLDTLFIMMEGSVARPYKGHVVISQQAAEDQWIVNLLSIQENGDLVYKAITNKTEINKVQQITPTEELARIKDSGPQYRIKPTMKEFDQLIKDKKIFIECEYLSRVNLEQSFIYLN